MPVDIQLLGQKLRDYRDQFQFTLEEVSRATGIIEARLSGFETGRLTPTGDELLILADFYKCDYKFFISNQQLAPFQETKTLFRMFDDELTKEDRWAIQEFLFLCECEQFVWNVLDREPDPFTFTKHGSFMKGHGKEAARALRARLGYQPDHVPADVFSAFRAIGLHVFRRALANTAISGLFVRHPIAGACVLVNYSEDIYRQRFTAAHEAAHAILDDEAVGVSFDREHGGIDLKEVRANTFASHFLLPPESLSRIPDLDDWNQEKALTWAKRFRVSTAALAIALQSANLISSSVHTQMRMWTVPLYDKVDPELQGLSAASRNRKESALKRGLSGAYIRLCFEAYQQGHISAARLAEMLLTDGRELHRLAAEHQEPLDYGT